LVVALITGASRGIGAATARLFAEAGFDLLLLARSSDQLSSLVAELRASGRRVEATNLDLGDPAAVQPGLLELCGRGLAPSVVINNAGAAWTGPLAEMPLESWQGLMQVNLTSMFQVCQALLPQLRHQGGGLILNVSSHAASNAFPGWGAYCASKAAVVAFSRCLAEEERIHGIRVGTLTLGSVNTPLWDSDTVDSSFDRRAMLSAEQAAAALLFMASQPSNQVVEDLTLKPAVGTF
jgi:short-subunit dehydrogenase